MIKFKWIYFLVVIFFMNACVNEKISKEDKLNNLDESEIIRQLGQPLRQSIIEIHKGTTFKEYQSDLFSIEEELEANDTVKVKEMYWEHNSNNQVVWLTEKGSNWIVFDNLTWPKDIQF